MRLKQGISLAFIAPLALAPAAAATITKTHVTTPSKNPTYLVANGNRSTVVVKGTTNSTSPSTDQVDIHCFYGPGRSIALASGVGLNSKGAFSTHALVAPAKDHRCRVVALPAGTSKSAPTFAGPWIDVSERTPYRVPSGPNAGKLDDYYIWGQQTQLANDYFSISSCGLCDSYLLNKSGGQTSIVYYANAYLWYDNSRGGSEIKVDGRDAYGPDSASSVFSGSLLNPGLPKLTYSFSQNKRTGDVTISETDQFARCSGSPSYPPTSATCPSFKSTGVEMNRKMVQTASGHVVSITDTYRSTDGRSHTLKLLYENDQCLATTSCISNIGYIFPGHKGYSGYSQGQVVHLPGGIGSIFVKALGAPDGDPSTGQGAITYSKAPNKGTFITPTYNGAPSEFTLDYAPKLSAKGTLTYRFSYATATTRAAVQRYAQAAQRAFKK